MQLALVGSMATDDPEGWEFFQHTFEYADGDPDIKILNNLNNVGAIEVNAFQSQSDVCLQKSIREGFGLTVTEALWKGRPTVAGNVGGIPLQIEDGETGFLVDSPGGVRAALPRDPRRPGAGQAPRAGRQGTRPQASSSRRACCATGWSCSPSSTHRLRALGVGWSRWPDSDPLIIVSNRGPAQFERDEDGERTVRRGGGGLVTALSGLVSHRDALWIASAMTDEDVAVSEERGGPVELSIDGIDYRVLLVGSDAEAYDRFYNVIANPILWFIQHYLWDLSNAPDIRQEELDAWDFGYQAVNRDIATRGAGRRSRGASGRW